MKKIKSVLVSLLICSLVFVNSSGVITKYSNLNNIENKTVLGYNFILLNDPPPSIG